MKVTREDVERAAARATAAAEAVAKAEAVDECAWKKYIKLKEAYENESN